VVVDALLGGRTRIAAAKQTPKPRTHLLSVQALGQRGVELVEGHAQAPRAAVMAQDALVVRVLLCSWVGMGAQRRHHGRASRSHSHLG